MYYVYMLVATCTSYVYVKYMYICLLLDMYMHIHIYIYIHMKQFWLVCSMCQTYWAHAFLVGCARHPATARNQLELGSSVQLPTLFPTLVALLPALAPSAVLVCTHWHVRVPVLCYCGAKHCV